MHLITIFLLLFPKSGDMDMHSKRRFFHSSNRSYSFHIPRYRAARQNLATVARFAPEPSPPPPLMTGASLILTMQRMRCAANGLRKASNTKAVSQAIKSVPTLVHTYCRNQMNTVGSRYMETPVMVRAKSYGITRDRCEI